MTAAHLPASEAETATRAAGAAVLDRFGRCDMFVHCAAAFDQAMLADVDAATWRHVQAVNVESALWLAQAFTPGMARRGFGRIIVIISDTFWSPPTAARTVNTDEQFDAAVERQALRRRLTPGDTAAAVAFLASDGAAAMTGQVLCADGGLVLR